MSKAEEIMLFRYTKEQLAIAAEVLEECGRYLYQGMFGFRPEELRLVAAKVKVQNERR